jgi:transcriptional regulator with XRE-family HTH domain
MLTQSWRGAVEKNLVFQRGLITTAFKEIPMALKADSRKLKRWREERQWSQEHLADLAGLGLRTVQRIEKGEAASRETLMALAAAFEVDVSSLCIDPEDEAARIARAKLVKGFAAARLGLFIHLASYALGMVVFAAISLGEGYFVMKFPMIWWTVGAAAHIFVILLVWIVMRHGEPQ